MAPTWKTSRPIRAFARGAAGVHRGLYRATGGKVGGSVRGVPIGLLTTRGRKSGRLYTWPVCCLPEGDGLLLVGSAGGAPRNPGWYYNVRANPEVTVEVGRETRMMIAEPQAGAARQAYWDRIVQEHPLFEGYQRKVTREIPVVYLRPPSAGAD